MAEYSFQYAIVYGLSLLASSHVTLKEQQVHSAKAVYKVKDVFVWLPTDFEKSLCYQILQFVFKHNLGLIGSGTSSAVMVFSPLVYLMVDQVQRL